jgi:hypothetical protein
MMGMRMVLCDHILLIVMLVVLATIVGLLRAEK